MTAKKSTESPEREQKCCSDIAGGRTEPNENVRLAKTERNCHAVRTRTRTRTARLTEPNRTQIFNGAFDYHL